MAMPEAPCPAGNVSGNMYVVCRASFFGCARVDASFTRK